MTDLTEARLAEIEARAKGATEGPWHVEPPDEQSPFMWVSHGKIGDSDRFDVCKFEPWDADGDGSERLQDIDYANAAFIARARDDVPALVAEVERLRAENERLSKPNMFWDYEDYENGCHDLTVIMDAHELGFVARIQCAKTLPDVWAVGYITESGGFNAKTFATEEEAEAFAAEQRAAPGDTK